MRSDLERYAQRELVTMSSHPPRRLRTPTVRRAMICLLIMLFAAVSNPGRVSSRVPLARFEFAEAHMGTRVRIVLYAPDAVAAGRASGAALRRIAQLEDVMSDYREASELNELCRRSGAGWVRVSDDLFRVLAAAQDVARRSGGAFDVTAGSLVRLWRRARRRGELPEAEALARARALTGYTKLHLDAGSRSIKLDDRGMRLDLGGIGKGYAADEAMRVLREHDVDRALVAVGGDIVAGEPPPGAEGWDVRIAGLSGQSGQAGDLLLRDGAVSTSGDAEQFVEIAGVRYSHVIDPRTGIGITGRTSVTIVAPRGITSDAIDTAVGVLGAEEGLRVVEKTDGAAAFIMRAHSGEPRTFQSKRWRRIYSGVRYSGGRRVGERSRAQAPPSGASHRTDSSHVNSGGVLPRCAPERNNVTCSVEVSSLQLWVSVQQS